MKWFVFFTEHSVQGGPNSGGYMTAMLSNLNRFKKVSLLNLSLKGYKLPSHLVYVATLPCETLMSAKQKPLTINYKVV